MHPIKLIKFERKFVPAGLRRSYSNSLFFKVGPWGITKWARVQTTLKLACCINEIQYESEISGTHVSIGT
jgi:hypothetical protein